MQKISALFLAVLITGLPFTSLAQKTWNVNDGDWNAANSWTPSGAPGSANQSSNDSIFGITEQSPNETVSIAVNSANWIRHVYLQRGKSVILNMADGASLTSNSTSALWQINTNYGGLATEGASHFTITGPESGTATVTMYGFQLASTSDGADGNSITFTGPGLIVKPMATASTVSVIGRWTNNNSFNVFNGADVDLYALWVGYQPNQGQGNAGNEAVVDNATLTISGGGTGDRGLRVGGRYGANGTSYDATMHNNSLTVTNNGLVRMTTGSGGGELGVLSVGDIVRARSNSILLRDGGAIEVLSGNQTNIGNTAGTNLGGNTMTIQDRARFSTNGDVFIYGYASQEARNDGANKLVIGPYGTFQSNATVTTRGVIELHQNGVMEGRELTGEASTMEIIVEKDGRFEVEGAGLASNVATRIEEGGTFAVGIAGAGEASVVELNSILAFTGNGSFLEISLFGSNESGHILLGADGAIRFDADVILTLTLEGIVPAVGDRWVLFSGETSHITGELILNQLPTLSGSLEWDTSLLNEAGGWQLSVIPEPGTVAYLLPAGLLVVLASLARRWERLALGRVFLSLKLLVFCSGAASLPCVVPTLNATEVMGEIMLAADENEVLKYKELSLPVDLKDAPPDSNIVLEFTAWYRTASPLGFYGTLRLFWDKAEIKETMDRPPSFTLVNQRRELATRRETGFMVAAIPGPEAVEDSAGYYYVPKEHMDVLTFRFQLPHSTDLHRLIIRNGLRGSRGEESPLILKNIKILFEKKS